MAHSGSADAGEGGRRTGSWRAAFTKVPPMDYKCPVRIVKLRVKEMRQLKMAAINDRRSTGVSAERGRCTCAPQHTGTCKVHNAVIQLLKII